LSIDDLQTTQTGMAFNMHQKSRRDALAPIRTFARLALLMSIAFTVWSVIRFEPWSDQTSIASQPSSIPWTNVNPVGVNMFLSDEVEVWKRERSLQMAAEGGVGWIRQVFPWNDIEPARGEHWDARYQQDAWAKYDNIVDLAEANGIRIIARLDQTPAWARPDDTDAATPPSNFEDYGDFVFDFVSRYKGRISFIQIWNEPNLAREWGGSIDPAGYAALLEIAARRAREANPDIVILSAPMAMTTENSARATDEFTYWQALYDLGAGEWFDIMSANVYGLSDPYDANPDYHRLNTRRVELLRDLAVLNGDERKAIWFNEYGWNAAPDDFPSDKLIWSRVDEQTQAEWTAAGIRFGSDNWDWFGVANIWYFRDVGNVSPEDADYYFRMVDVEFTPRDVYREVQRFSHSLGVATPGLHSMLDSPVRAYGSWDLIQRVEYHDGYAIVGHSGSSLRIQFRGSALDVHVVPDQSRGSVAIQVVEGNQATQDLALSRIVELPAEGGYVRLTSDQIDHPATSAQQTYTVHVNVLADSTLVLDHIRVEYSRSYSRVIAGVAASGLAFVILVVLRQRRVHS
jgi:polysaccharide biosynthesis protein PslG